MTSTTSSDASKIVRVTSVIDSRMKVDESKATSRVSPSPSPALMSAASFLTASATARVLAFDCLMTPMPMAGAPL